MNFEAWLEERKFRITGSKIYEIFTYASNVNPDWKSKCHKYFNPKKFKTEYTEFGIKYENEARQMFSQYTKSRVEEVGLVVSKLNPWLGYSPDGLILDDSGKVVKLLEIKNLKDGDKKTIKDAIFEGSFKSCLVIDKKQVAGQKKPELIVKGLNKKHKYYGQIQLGMFILYLQDAVFAVYAPFDTTMLTISVKYDAAFVAKMLRDVKNAYFNLIIHHVCDQSCKKK